MKNIRGTYRCSFSVLQGPVTGQSPPLRGTHCVVTAPVTENEQRNVNPPFITSHRMADYWRQHSREWAPDVSLSFPFIFSLMMWAHNFLLLIAHISEKKKRKCTAWARRGLSASVSTLTLSAGHRRQANATHTLVTQEFMGRQRQREEKHKFGPYSLCHNVCAFSLSLSYSRPHSSRMLCVAWKRK